MKKLTALSLLFIFLLAGCQSHKKYEAKGQDERIQYIVVHYTALNFEDSLRVLTQNNVSSHYLIDESGKVYQLVDEKKRAWHAGVSEWKGRTSLNNSSIGIELVNLGYTETTPENRVWYQYSDKQIKSLKKLLKDIQSRYGIPAENVLGHSDISPQRKNDPGPYFPWKDLAKEGIAFWPNENSVAAEESRYRSQGIPNTLWVQKKLASIGYEIRQTGVMDEQTQKTIIAFQMRYQPENFTGVVDAKTAALLSVIANR